MTSNACQKQRARLALPVLLIVAGASIAAADVVLPPWFESHGLSSDGGALLRYLSEGFPASLEPVREGPYSVSRLPWDRWPQYAEAVQRLGDVPEANAVLRRLAQEALPDRVIEDMLYAIALDWQSWETYDDWDRRAAVEAAQFRMKCGLKLAALGSQDAEEVNLELIARFRPLIEARMSEWHTGGTLVGHYASLCTEATQMGHPEGLDALISLLPVAHDAYGGSNLVSYLKRLAGPRFPIEHDMPEPDYREAVRQWQTWWASSRDSFEGPAEVWSRPDEKAYRYPPPANARRLERALAYIGASTEYAGHSDVVYPAHSEAKEWLEQNARRYGRQLRKIAEDPSLPQHLRFIAAEWYVKTGGKRAVRWAREQVLEWKPDESDAFVAAPLDMFRLIRQHPEGNAIDIARECLDRYCHATPAAVGILLGPDDDEAEGVLARYADLVRRFPEVRRTIAGYLGSHPAPGELDIFADILRNAEPDVVHVAIQGIQRRNLVESLPPSAREDYDRWLRDRSMRLKLIANIGPRELQEKAVLDLVRAHDGTDAAAARVYAFGYHTLTRYGHGPLTAEAQQCLDALGRCIDAYRASRADVPPWGP